MGSVPMNTLLKHDCNIRGFNPTMGEVLEEIMKQLETDLVTGKVATGNGVRLYLGFGIRSQLEQVFSKHCSCTRTYSRPDPGPDNCTSGITEICGPNSSSVGIGIAHH
jgi:hypothetical protein